MYLSCFKGNAGVTNFWPCATALLLYYSGPDEKWSEQQNA